MGEDLTCRSNSQIRGNYNVKIAVSHLGNVIGISERIREHCVLKMEKKNQHLHTTHADVTLTVTGSEMTG